MTWFLDNAGTLAVAAVVFLLAAAAVWYVVRAHRACGSCAFCVQRAHCARRKN